MMTAACQPQNEGKRLYLVCHGHSTLVVAEAEGFIERV